MKQITIYLIVIIFLSLFGCGFESLPFSKGKFIYWLIPLTIGAIYFLINKSKNEYVLKKFDILIMTMILIGLLNFIYVSKSTIYNIKIWYYFGYLILYIVLRQELRTKEIINKSLNFMLLFISLTAILNVLIAILQKINILQSSNEYFNSTGLFYSPNQLGIYLALGFLSILELLRKTEKQSLKIIFCAGLIILLFGLYLSECRGAYLGLSIAVLFLLYNSNIKTTLFFSWKKTLFSLTLLSLLLLVFLNTNSIKSESVSGRWFIVKHSLDQIKEHPISGYGINTFSLQYNLAKAQYFSIERNWNDTKNASYIYNANNDFLELTFEFGVIWLIVFTFFFVRLGKFSIQSDETKICSAILLCLFLFASTNTLLVTPLFLIIGCYCVVVIINLSDLKSIYSFSNYFFFKIIIVLMGLAFLSIMFLRINAEHKLLSYYRGKKSFKIEKSIKKCSSKIDANGEELFMTGGILLKNKYYDEGLIYLAMGFESSGKPSLGKILAGFYEKQGRYNEAEEIYKYNMNVEPFRYNANMDLFRLYIKSNQIQKAREMANKIINKPIKIQSKEVNSYKEEATLYLKRK